jgi:hypothetical protein
MNEPAANPYHAGGVIEESGIRESATPPKRHWSTWLTGCLCCYYLVSAVTLPFTNKVWVGEIPILAVFQLPKSFLKSIAHDLLLSVVRALGWSRGSASPDSMMTHPWAMVLMLTAPALLWIVVVCYLRRGRTQTAVMAAILACAGIDAVVTFWFDASSSLKLYNASYF